MKSLLYANINAEIYIKSLIKSLFSRYDNLSQEVINNFKYEANISKHEKLYFCNSGRNALKKILTNLNIKKGDEVIIQSFTCIVVPLAISALGAIPVYISPSKKTLNIEINDQIKNLINIKTKAIILQYTFGNSKGLNEVANYAKSQGIMVIEDLAAGFKSINNDEDVDGRFYSFEMSKMINCGWGGAYWINKKHKIIEEDTLKKENFFSGLLINFQVVLSIILYSHHLFIIRKLLIPILIKCKIFKLSISKNERLGKPEKLKPTKLTKFQLALIFYQLKNFKKKLENNKLLIAKYKSILQNCGLEEISLSGLTLSRYPIRTNCKSKLIEKGKQVNIELGGWFMSPLHPVTDKNILSKLGYNPLLLNYDQEICDSILNLPLGLNINTKDVEKIAIVLKKNII